MTGRGAAVPFVRVVPEEIGRYGFAGATFIAHIRYRCATDGPGRFVADGVRWWEVSLADLAAELHVSKDVAQRTIKRLGDAVTAKRFGPPRDQTRAYRVSVDGIGLTTQNAESHRPDLSERDSAPTPTRNRTDPDAESRSVPISGESEEGEEAALRGGRECESELSDAGSATANAASPTQADIDADAFWAETDPAADVIDAEGIDPTDADRRLVADLIADYPRVVADRLRRAVGTLRGEGVADDVIADALRKWGGRTDAKPGLLPHLVGDVMKERRAAAAAAQASRIAAQTALSPAQPAYRCHHCADTGIVLMNDGTAGSHPRGCNHDGSRRDPTHDELAAYAQHVQQRRRPA